MSDSPSPSDMPLWMIEQAMIARAERLMGQWLLAGDEKMEIAIRRQCRQNVHFASAWREMETRYLWTEESLADARACDKLDEFDSDTDFFHDNDESNLSQGALELTQLDVENLEEEMVRRYRLILQRKRDDRRRRLEVEAAKQYFRSRGAPVSVPIVESALPTNCPSVRGHVLVRDDYTCQHCRREFKELSRANIRLEIHHIIPRSRGGQHHLDNLITLCADCRSLTFGK